MNDTPLEQLPNKPGSIIKSVLLFIGRAILVVLALLVIVSSIIDTFEGSVSFLEISVLEMIFFVVFIYLVKNHIDVSNRRNLGWRGILYRPLRNLGWYGLTVLVVGFILVVRGDLNESMEDAQLGQIINFIIIVLCIYFATPKARDKKSAISTEETKK